MNGNLEPVLMATPEAKNQLKYKLTNILHVLSIKQNIGSNFSELETWLNPGSCNLIQIAQLAAGLAWKLDVSLSRVIDKILNGIRSRVNGSLQSLTGLLPPD